MEKISKYFLMLIMGMLATAPLASCDDDPEDSDETWRENPTVKNNWDEDSKSYDMWEAANQYVNNVVYYTYTNLATQAEKLYDAAVTMQTKLNSGTLTDTDVETTANYFKAAREYWEKSEAFLFGAASDFNIDPHIDSWPLSQDQVANFLSSSTMVEGLYSSDPIAFVSKNNSVFDTALGFHGLEFILFRDGSVRKASVFSGSETFEGKTISCKDEVAFLVAVAGDVRDHCYWLEVAWKGNSASSSHMARIKELGKKTHASNDNGYYYGADMLLAADNNSSYKSMAAVLATIVGGSGCGNIANEVAQQKLGQAWRAANNQSLEDDEDDPTNYIESPYSHRSFIDYRDNLYSIKNSLYGNFDGATPNENSIMNLLKYNKYSGYSTLNTALEEAISSLTTMIDAGKVFVEIYGSTDVKNAIEKIDALNTQLETAASWIQNNLK